MLGDLIAPTLFTIVFVALIVLLIGAVSVRLARRKACGRRQ